MSDRGACAVGFYPGEDATHDPAFVEKAIEVPARAGAAPTSADGPTLGSS